MPNKPSPMKTISWETKKNKRDIAQGVFLQAVLSRREMSQVQLSRELGVSEMMVSHVIWGRRKSKKVQNAMAQKLGYKSWKALIKEQNAFERAWPFWGVKK